MKNVNKMLTEEQVLFLKNNIKKENKGKEPKWLGKAISDTQRGLMMDSVYINIVARV